MSSKSKLFLIPNTLGNENVNQYLPSGIADSIKNCRIFFVEHPKLARKVLIGLGLKNILDDSEMISMKNGLRKDDRRFIEDCLKSGKEMGIISDAGCPAVADPGFEIVKQAHYSDAEILPFVGPSSIILGLMGSGFNGQNFTFHGYIPKEKGQRIRKIREMEQNVFKNNQTQIFIETPYRNQYLFSDLLSTCQKNTKICLAVNLTLPDQWIKTKDVIGWKKEKVDLNKKQCIFLLYK